MTRNNDLEVHKVLEESILNALSSKSHLQVNIKLLRQLGCNNALVLSNYIDKYKYFKEKRILTADGRFYLSHEKQVETLGMSEYAVIKAKHYLRDNGLISIKNIGLPARECIKINVLTIAKILAIDTPNSEDKDPNISESSDHVPQDSPVLALLDSGGQATQDTRGHNNRYIHTKENQPKRVHAHTCEEEKEKTSLKELSPELSYITPTMFDDFWDLFPNKGGKGSAKTAWLKLCSKGKERPTCKTLILAIEAQKKSERWQDPKFIPLFSTWLNQSRWLDDPKLMISFNRDSRPAKIIEYGEWWHLNKNGNYYNENGELLYDR